MSDLRMYLSYPRGSAFNRRRVLADLVARGEIAQVTIEKARASEAWFALTDDLPELDAATGETAPSRGTALLTPFDSLLWHRLRAHRLFGFEYRIEVYTPGHKRVHGYYVLPILHDGQLIGRVDAKTHRQAGLLEAKRIHFEPWFARGEEPLRASWGIVDRDRALAGVADALRSLATFEGVDEIAVRRVVPSRLGPPLKRALAGD